MSIEKDILWHAQHILPFMTLEEYLLFISLPSSANADTWKGRELAETHYFT